MPTAPRDLSASGTLYSVLGVTPDASRDEVRRAPDVRVGSVQHEGLRRADRALQVGVPASLVDVTTDP